MVGEVPPTVTRAAFSGPELASKKRPPLDWRAGSAGFQLPQLTTVWVLLRVSGTGQLAVMLSSPAVTHAARLLRSALMAWAAWVAARSAMRCRSRLA